MTPSRRPKTTASAQTSAPAPAIPAAPAGHTGIYRLDGDNLPALEAAAKALGQAVFTVDLGRARNMPGILKAMKRDLRFPESFGNNLDALNDCLTDFSWHPAAGYVIILAHGEGLQANPSSLATLNEVLAFAAEHWENRRVPFRVFYLRDRL